MALLSASMIVRNEVTHLEACLLSFRDLVDEIVIVDTGSTDGTQDIALRLGARLHAFEWCDDFSAARNEALGHSRGAWILSIDADERLRPTCRQRLTELLRDRANVACSVQRHPRASFLPFWEIRLFRNDPLIRFEGIIHENIWPSVARYQDAQGGKVGRAELVLDHIGDDGNLDRKHELYLPLLLKAVEQDPDRIYCWSHLGTIYRGLGQLEKAREAWRSGIAAARRRKILHWGDSVPYVKMIQLEVKAGRNVDALVEEALGLFPDHAHLLWLRGLARMNQRRYAGAIKDFTRLTRWRSDRHQSDGLLGYSERLFGARPYRALAACYRQLGQDRASQRCLELAKRCE